MHIDILIVGNGSVTFLIDFFGEYGPLGDFIFDGTNILPKG